MHFIFKIILLCICCNVFADYKTTYDNDVVYFVEKDNKQSNYVGKLQNFILNKSIQAVNKIYLRKTKNVYSLCMTFDDSVSFTPRIHTMPEKMKILLTFSKPIISPKMKRFKHRLIKNLVFEKIGESSLLIDLSFNGKVKFLSKKYTNNTVKITFQIIKKRRIIIDAGHGGSDPGTIGINGESEKNITLQFARELQEMLTNTGKYDVIMVRQNDIYYPVEDRVADVMKIRADMLISIHTDSNPVPQIHGMSIYTLPEILRGRSTTKAYMDNLHKSRNLAQRIMGYIPRTCKIKKNPSRSVELKILKIGIPAILIELGCLSNKIDSELLGLKVFREKINCAILYALDDFFAQRRK